MGSHYIPVNSLKLDGVSIQPEVYCPANGFPDPAGEDFPEVLQNYPEALGQACIIGGYVPDPEIYIPPTVISEMPVPGDGEIFLLCADNANNHIYFKCTTNSGQYNVKVYGVDEVTPVVNQNINSNSYFSYDLIVGTGKQESGYTSFLIVISPFSPNYITSFQASFQGYYPVTSNNIISAKFKTPQITSLYNAFQNNLLIQYIELIGDMNVLTTLEGVVQGAISLNKFVCASSLNALTTLKNAFSNCTELKSLSLIDSLPELLSMESMLYGTCGVLNFVMPNSLPKLTTLRKICNANKATISFTFTPLLPELLELSECFYQSNIVTINLPTSCPKVTTLANFADTAPKLKGILTFPEMTACTTLRYAFYNALMVNEIHFTGGMPICNSVSSMVSACKALTKLTMPTSINKIGTGGTNGFADTCESLREITMPLSMEYDTGIAQETVFLYAFSACYCLEVFTKMNTWPNRSVPFQMAYCKNLVRFDQPDANIRSLSFGSSLSGIPLQLNYFDIAWSKLFNDNNYKAISLTFVSAGSVAFPISEIERITNAFIRVPAENGFTAQFSINANTPNIAVADRNSITFSTPSAGAVVLQRQSGQLTTSWVVGDRVSLNQSIQAKECGRTATISGDTITKTAHTIPNGTEISFASLTGITGVLLNTVYYVVEAATNVFKVSDSPGGSAIAMSGTGSCTFRAFPKVVAVGASTVTIDFCYDVVAGTWGITTSKYAEAMIKARHKGWNCS